MCTRPIESVIDAEPASRTSGWRGDGNAALADALGALAGKTAPQSPCTALARPLLTPDGPTPRCLSPQPLERDDQHEIIRGLNQKGDQAFVMLAEM